MNNTQTYKLLLLKIDAYRTLLDLVRTYIIDTENVPEFKKQLLEFLTELNKQERELLNSSVIK